MFLAGADGQTPELRAPSIKGAMRFWWRALNGHLGVKEMKAKEDGIFGGVTKNAASRSKVTLRVKQTGIKTGRLPRTKDDKIQNPGIHYLWYTIPMNNDRPGIWEGDFTVQLTSFESLALEEAAFSFWMLANFGGLGTRSRRGAGSFKIKHVTYSASSGSFEFVQLKTEPLAEYLRRNIAALANRYGFERRFTPTSPTPFPVLQNTQIHVFQEGEESALAAVERIGASFQRFREKLRPDYNEVKNYITSGISPKQVQRAEFGLPLSFRYTSLDKYGKAGAAIKTTKKEIDRSASSMIIHINEANARYYVVITNFASALLPGNENLKVMTPRRNLPQYFQQRPGIVNQPYQGIKETFLDTLKADII
jgi:CRISPR-associated protein Cmr1